MIVARTMMSHQSLNEKVAKIKSIRQKIGFVNGQYQIHEVENAVDLAQGITEEEKEAAQTRGIDLKA